jgi:hypothetical protein
MRNQFLLAALLWPFVAGAASPIQSFDVKGAATTCAIAINGPGLILGLAQGGMLPAAKYFLYHSATGKFSFPTPNVPRNLIFLDGLTSQGDILVADFNLSKETQANYLYHDGVATRLRGRLANHASGINDSSMLFGTTAKSLKSVGFVLRSSGAVKTISDGSEIIALDAIDITGNRVVGESLNGYFFEKGGKFTYLQAPGATLLTWPRGVDSHDRVSGTFYTGTQSQPIPNGFLFHAGAYTTWNVPGATATTISNANESGQIAGCYTDPTGTHGFVATP